MFQCFYPSSFLDKKWWKGSTETVIAVTYYNQQANQTWQHLQFNFPFFSWWETRNRKISTVTFRMAKENYLWRYRSLQFRNKLTRKLHCSVWFSNKLSGFCGQMVITLYEYLHMCFLLYCLRQCIPKWTHSLALSHYKLVKSQLSDLRYSWKFENNKRYM